MNYTQTFCALSKRVENRLQRILGDGETPAVEIQTNACIFALPMHSIGWSRRGMGETACALLGTRPLPQNKCSSLASNQC